MWLFMEMKLTFGCLSHALMPQSCGGWMGRCDQVLLEDEVVLFVDDLILSQFQPIL
jgi:hypothetical protein